MQSAIRNPKSAIIRVALTLVVALLIATVAHACPTCSEAIGDADPSQKAMAAGYYYSILFMMSMPFAILGTFGSMAYLSIRRARAEQADDDSTEA